LDRQTPEGRGIDLLTLLAAHADELRDQLGTYRSERLERRPDHGCRGVLGKRTEQKRVLAYGRSYGVPRCPPDPLVWSVVSASQGREGHRCHPAVSVAAERHDRADEHVVVGERGDAPLEC